MPWFEQLTWIDAVVIGVIGASMLLSLARGLVKEIASLAVWVLAVVGASRLAHYPAELLPQWMTPPIQQTVGFLVMLVLILVIGKLITAALKELVSAAGIGMIDRLLGLGFGLARGALIVVVLAILAAMTSLPRSEAWQRAMTRSALEFGIRMAAPWLPQMLGEKIKVPSSGLGPHFNRQGVAVCVA